ncbi:hypothetical protein AB0F88_17325 [Streptosporangium sp. NPDC023963]|uniref:hypothetical protein n=1 Tax=Streptosporangium sp. NPDC023963 TaxID=3155608 RepID=UPI00344072EF
MSELRRLHRALREELAELWHDLAAAYQRSRINPPEQSQECRQLIRRIEAITRQTGPTPPGDIGFVFLLTGLYQQLHERLGVDVPIPDGLLQHAHDFVRLGGRLSLGYPEGLVEEHRDRRIYFHRKGERIFYRIADRTGTLPGRFDTLDDARAALEDLSP